MTRGLKKGVEELIEKYKEFNKLFNTDWFLWMFIEDLTTLLPTNKDEQTTK